MPFDEQTMNFMLQAFFGFVFYFFFCRGGMYRAPVISTPLACFLPLLSFPLSSLPLSLYSLFYFFTDLSFQNLTINNKQIHVCYLLFLELDLDWPLLCWLIHSENFEMSQVKQLKDHLEARSGADPNFRARLLPSGFFKIIILDSSVNWDQVISP